MFPHIALAALLAAQSGSTQGDPPGRDQPLALGARDIFAFYHLPPLKDGADDPLYREAQSLQVLSRARALHLDAHSATDAWKSAEPAFAHAQALAGESMPTSPLLFTGKRASELNAILAGNGSGDVRVSSPELTLDQPLRITRDHTRLDLGTARLKPSESVTPYLVRIENVHDVRISGGVVDGAANAATWAMLISGSSDVSVFHTRISGLRAGGVLVDSSTAVILWGGEFHSLGAAPILIHGASRQVVVAENVITNNLGSSNWNAGIVLTDRNANLVESPTNLLLPDQFGVQVQPIPTRLRIPEDNIVTRNTISRNLSSGIYSDGSARNVFVDNRIEENSKEGTCLDNGSTANVIAYNTYRANGKRWGKTDSDLRRDFIADFGRLPDGSSPAKVPAISIDNAAYNQVLFNQLDRNYGGGIKMVRTAFYNLIGLNTLTDDNEGQNPRFHFFGIELGAARADVPVPDLDFAPSRGNEIFSNIISGTHYAGVFFADGSDQNTLFDNTIFGATMWAMESVRPQTNLSFNNLSNLKLRNISAGLDPALITLGAGQFDPPRR